MVPLTAQYKSKARVFHFIFIHFPFPVHSMFRFSHLVEGSQLACCLQPALHMVVRFISLKYSSVQLPRSFLEGLCGWAGVGLILGEGADRGRRGGLEWGCMEGVQRQVEWTV